MASLLRISSSLAASSFSDKLPSSSSSLSLQSSFGCFSLSFSPPLHFLPLSLVRTNAVPLASSSSLSPIQLVLQGLGNGEHKQQEEEKKEEEAAAAEEEEFIKDKICASNLPWTSTPEDIRSLFEQFGTVVHIEVPMHAKDKSRGLAFVTMGSPEEAASAMEKLSDYEYGGRPVRVNYAKPKKLKAVTTKDKPPAFCLYVSNLSYEATEEDLAQLFVQGGADILTVEIIYTRNPRRSSGFGFVFFKNKRRAEEAISTFQDKELMGRPIKVARGRQFLRSPRVQGYRPGRTAAAAAATDANETV
ncbi:31 kDa ribonucleoprotein, chloroplastic [Linum grandiflorum]